MSRAALEAQTPTGWRRPWWFVRGRLRSHREALAAATTAASYARDLVMAHARVVSGRAHEVEVELKKAARRHPVEVQQRRAAEANAALTMERAAIAADLLRADPGRGALPIPHLLLLADAERHRREAIEEPREVLDVVSSGPRPR